MARNAANRTAGSLERFSMGMETLEVWLETTAQKRAQLMTYGQTGKPDTAEGRALDSMTAIQMTDEAARIRNEAICLLTKAREQAMWDARKKYPELNSRERERVEKSAVRQIQLLVDACEITYKSCLSRYFNLKGNY